jgi:hypothetical protein
MLTFLRFVFTLADRLVSRIWNLFAGLRRKRLKVGLWLGYEIQDGHTTRKKVFLANIRRAEHLSITGKTGTGKSYFLRSLIAQDLEQRNGFVLFDIHGDLTPYVLQAVSNLERKTGQNLSTKLIIIDPSDPESSCGFNVLEGRGEQNIYRLISEFTHILENRWGQEFGPRTLELLSNSLHVLSENNLTLLELAALLTNASFRAQCLKRVTNNEVKTYFESRFNPTSEAMQQAMSGPVLNKLAGFTIDPKFRHLLGQAESTFSLQQVLEKNLWLVIKLSKGELGEQAMTFGSLLFVKLKNAIFARRSRSLLSVYADEVQNLLSSDLSLEVLLSECRKFNVSLVTANQYFAQLPAQIQAALAAIGTHIYFQLSVADANHAAKSLGSGTSLAGLLQNLPRRTLVLKTGSQSFRQIATPPVHASTVDYDDLYERCRTHWCRKRDAIEAEILKRQPTAKKIFAEVSDAWE